MLDDSFSIATRWSLMLKEERKLPPVRVKDQQNQRKKVRGPTITARHLFRAKLMPPNRGLKTEDVAVMPPFAVRMKVVVVGGG